jgi:hypothetical protein
MEEQSYAIYEAGRESPIGTVVESLRDRVNKMEKFTGKAYRLEPISPEEAKRIRELIIEKSIFE